ncbi:hypothetical protein [Anaerocolumna xylanovorans]|uniref:Uncharacterized protein n=1 Tax=Anaerocolumna xylanovorans DSM 12503 TaxID=1121345 RepID=A0A1M7YIR4_9FIRM|nr:hypothetical protein [Anaerocolumna xylanovorans]SHO52525.1 hypothetical protein SAMN02745217_03699 [Anaerocolumna xylanovorans DSM 12503]
MELIKRRITVHGGKEVYVLTPGNVSKSITAGHDNKGFVLTWGNGSGYQFLAECFSAAADLQKNEILYLPVRYQASEEFIESFGGCEYNYNIVCTNYCETRISPKDIEEILKIKIWTEELIIRRSDIHTEYIDRWKTNKRLTVKIHKKNMYISTNRDGFHSLSCGACNLTEYGDEYIEDYLPHMHYDWNENTSVSVGVTLYYWHDR